MEALYIPILFNRQPLSQYYSHEDTSMDNGHSKSEYKVYQLVNESKGEKFGSKKNALFLLSARSDYHVTAEPRLNRKQLDERRERREKGRTATSTLLTEENQSWLKSISRPKMPPR